MKKRLRYDRLEVCVFADAADLARHAADIAASVIARAIAERGEAFVMFASGNSQLLFLERLAEHSEVDWSRVTGCHMDEYVGLDARHPASFARYMREHVAVPLALREFHYIDGAAADAQAEADRYAALLALWRLDLCCLGIGENGHLAFNDPAVADFDDPSQVKIVTLDAMCRNQQVGEGHFATFEDVPARAVTVTIPVLLSAHRVVAIVPEARKAVPVRDALEGPVATSCPASILRRRENAALFLDSESASLLAARP